MKPQVTPRPQQSARLLPAWLDFLLEVKRIDVRRKVEGKRGGEGGEMWVGGELWKDWERASAAFASSAVFSIKYGSQKHIPVRCEGVSTLRSGGIRKGKRKRGEDRRWEDGSWRWDDSKKRSETQILYTPGDFLKESAYWAFWFLHTMRLWHCNKATHSFFKSGSSNYDGCVELVDL